VISDATARQDRSAQTANRQRRPRQQNKKTFREETDGTATLDVENMRTKQHEAEKQLSPIETAVSTDLTSTCHTQLIASLTAHKPPREWDSN